MPDNINALHYRANGVFDNTKNKSCKQYSTLWKRKIMSMIGNKTIVRDFDKDQNGAVVAAEMLLEEVH